MNTLLQAYPLDMHALHQALSRHLNASDLEEVQKIVAEIQQRIERFQRGAR